jgi:hypothetical protein
MISTGYLHHIILRHIIDFGFAPEVPALMGMLNLKREDVTSLLFELQHSHGVVLHPHTPKVWAIHPFSLAPTNFLVRSSDKLWWGNCAWCSLGIAALLQKNVSIITRIGGHDKQVVIRIEDGEVVEDHFVIHFPIPMKNAWDNVTYTCSNMLVFENETQVDDWVRQHNITKGDLQTIGKIWDLSKAWYGQHLSPNWKKWTLSEAREIFRRFDLSGDIWELDDVGERF